MYCAACYISLLEATQDEFQKLRMEVNKFTDSSFEPIRSDLAGRSSVRDAGHAESQGTATATEAKKDPLATSSKSPVRKL